MEAGRVRDASLALVEAAAVSRQGEHGERDEQPAGQGHHELDQGKAGCGTARVLERAHWLTSRIAVIFCTK